MVSMACLLPCMLRIGLVVGRLSFKLFWRFARIARRSCQNSPDAQGYRSTCIVEDKCNICFVSRSSSGSRSIFLDSHLAIRSVHTSTIDLCKGFPATRYSVLGLVNATVYTRSALRFLPAGIVACFPNHIASTSLLEPVTAEERRRRLCYQWA
jgi:hypothetical protein